MSQTNVLKTILQQPTVDDMQRLVNQLAVEELVSALPKVALNKRVLLFLLLEDTTSLAVFRRLAWGDRVMLLHAMEEPEYTWLLSLLDPAEQAALPMVLGRVAPAVDCSLA